MRFLLMPTIALLGLSFAAQAQIDPSSALLLNRGGRGEAGDSGVDSGRYQVRPRTDSSSARREANPATIQPARKSTGAPDAAPQSTNQLPAEPIFLTVPDGPAAGTPQPPVVPSTSSPTLSATPSPASTPVKEESDRRLNIVELSVSPGFIYNGSESPYTYRSYNMAAPALGIDAGFWLSPHFGFQAGYLSTLSGHVSDSLVGTKSAPTTQLFQTVGIRSRKFFNGDAGVARLVLGFDYYDYQFKVPSDSVIRAKLGSTGVLLTAEAEVPVSYSRAWTAGFSFAPKLQHKETSAATRFHSGNNVDSNLVGVSLGGRLRFDYNDSFFWRVSHSVEKDLFSGKASRPDPVTGQVPSGVGVINSFTIFQFGYTWGN